MSNDKQKIVEQLNITAPAAMVAGINDEETLAKATIGVSMSGVLVTQIP